MKRIIILTLTFLTFVVACSSDDEQKAVGNKDFYKKYYENNILPSITSFKENVDLLKLSIENFKASTTDANHKKITEQWLVTAKSYEKSELYNFGLIKQRYFKENIFNFPINTTKIEENIAEEKTYDTAYFSTKSTVTKGLSTIEYLLYGNDYNTENAKNVLINNSNRLNYLIGVTVELKRMAELLITTWENEYFETYINADKKLCSDNAKCLTINQIINVIDMAKVTKIGKPFGYEKSENINPKTLEAFRSRNSLLLIKAMLDEVKYVYFKSNANISTLVDNINSSKEISTQLKNKFNTLDNQINTFNNNLYDAVNTDAQSIKPIYLTLKEITTLFSVDVTSTLSVTTLPTDNDGD